MKTLGIIGSADLGQLIAYHSLKSTEFSKVVYFDDFKTVGDVVGHGNVIGRTKDVLTNFKNGAFDELMIGIGYNHMEIRAELFNAFYGTIPFANIIHKTSYIEENVSLGQGLFILPMCVIDSNSVIGNNVLLNTACVIAHDAIIKDHCFFGPSVNIAGFTLIGECCNLGIGTTIIDNIQVYPLIRTGGGTVVIDNLKKQGTYIGVPARLMKS